MLAERTYRTTVLSPLLALVNLRCTFAPADCKVYPCYNPKGGFSSGAHREGGYTELNHEFHTARTTFETYIPSPTTEETDSRTNDNYQSKSQTTNAGTRRRYPEIR